MSNNVSSVMDPVANEHSTLCEKLSDTAAPVKDKVSDLGRTPADKIDENRDAAASGLDKAASAFHEKAESLHGGEKVSSLAHATADKLNSRVHLTNPVMYLPRKPIKEIGKGRVIYGPENPTDRVYLIVLGRVKVMTTAAEGYETIARILCADDLLGEAILVGGHSSETAVVLDSATLMSWTRAEIEAQIEREPRLGLALAQYFVRQCLALQERIECVALRKTPERVLLALAQLAELLGTPQPDGAIRVDSLTHQTIADYMGTSREIVSFQMNRIRRLGLIGYNRRYIDVYSRAVAETLRQHGIAAGLGRQAPERPSPV
jgi:CRP-like cAMP-binding protein